MSATYLPTKKFCDRINKKIFFFYMGEGKSELITRKVIQTPRELGGLGLSDIVTKPKAIYFQHNFMSPSSDNFDHQ